MYQIQSQGDAHNTNLQPATIHQRDPAEFYIALPNVDKRTYSRWQHTVINYATLHRLLADQAYTSDAQIRKACRAVLQQCNFDDPSSPAYLTTKIAARWTVACLRNSPIKTLLDGLRGSEENVTASQGSVDLNKPSELFDQTRVAKATFNLFARDCHFNGLLATNSEMRDWLAAEADTIVQEIQQAGLLKKRGLTGYDNKKILDFILLIVTTFNDRIIDLLQQDYTECLRKSPNGKDAGIYIHSWAPAIENCISGLVGNITNKLLTGDLLPADEVYHIGSLAKNLANKPIKVDKIEAACKKHIHQLFAFASFAELVSKTILCTYSYSRQPIDQMLQSLHDPMQAYSIPTTVAPNCVLPIGLVVFSFDIGMQDTLGFIVADGVNQTLSLGCTPKLGSTNQINPSAEHPILLTRLYRTNPRLALDVCAIWGSAVVQLDQNGHIIYPFNSVPYTSYGLQKSPAIDTCFNFAKELLSKTWLLLETIFGAIGQTESPIILHYHDLDERHLRIYIPEDLAMVLAKKEASANPDSTLAEDREAESTLPPKELRIPPIILDVPNIDYSAHLVPLIKPQVTAPTTEQPVEQPSETQLTLSDRRIQAVLKKTSTILRILRQDFGVKLDLRKGKGSHSRLERGGHHTTASRALLKQTSQVFIIPTFRNKLLDLHIPERDFVLAALKYLRIEP